MRANDTCLNNERNKTVTYTRVIPRDLFNESKVLKCYGQLALLILDGLIDRLPLELEHDYVSYEGFTIKQDGQRAHIYCDNLHLILNGKQRIMLGVPINSREPFPMVYVMDNDDEGEVFANKGKLSDEFKQYCRHLLDQRETVWTKVGIIRHYSVWYNESKEIYNVTPDNSPPNDSSGGYPVLESLIKLKGFDISEYRGATPA
jgi:hypothetical protein